MLTILVLGPGCVSCNRLAQRCQDILKDDHLEGVVNKVSDINQIAALGVTELPVSS